MTGAELHLHRRARQMAALREHRALGGQRSQGHRILFRDYSLRRGDLFVVGLRKPALPCAEERMRGMHQFYPDEPAMLHTQAGM